MFCQGRHITILKMGEERERSKIMIASEETGGCWKALISRLPLAQNIYLQKQKYMWEKRPHRKIQKTKQRIWAISYTYCYI